MCKPGKSVNTEIKSYSFVREKALQEPAVQAGLRPVQTLWLDQPPLGMSKKTDCLKRRARDAPSLLSSLLTLLNCGTRRSYASRFRGYALQRAPVRWTLTSEPTIGGGLRLCQSRNGATNSTIAEESFPGDVTQPSQVSTREQPKEPEPPTWPPRTKNWTHAGKRNQKATACFTSTTDSKYNKQSVFILTKLVNSIWMQ